MGGLVGYNSGSAANSISGSNTSGGTVTAQYGSGGSGSMPSGVGGLVGYNTNASSTAIVNSYSSENVTDTLNAGTQDVGGLAGYSAGTISGTSTASSYASGTVGYSGSAATVYIGGLVGNNAGTGGIISNSAASGSVTYNDTSAAAGTQANVGGLVGYNNGSAAKSISGSNATLGTVTAQYGSGGSGNMQGVVGGLVGNNSNASSTAIVNSDSTENINDSLTGATQYVGGLAGYNSGTISGTTTASSYASGTVAYTGTAGIVYIGGLAGQNAGAGGIITNSAATGSVTYNDTSAAAGSGAYVGGLVGYNSSSAAHAISGSDATTGVVTAQYGSGGSGAIAGYVGGLVGDNANTTSTAIANSYASENVNDTLGGSTQYLGGLAGYSDGTISGTSPASSYASGTVAYTGSASTVYIGGLAGQNDAAGGIISNSAANGSVTYNDTSSAAGIQADVGGLVGYNSGTAANSISGSNATIGTVTAQYRSGGSGGIAGFVGGLVGENANASATSIVNSSATENVNDTLSGGIQSVGGLAGYSDGTISGSSPAGSYAGGAVAYTGTAGTVYIGGLVGQNTAATGIITNSADTGGVSYTYTSAAAGSNAYVGGLVGFNSSTAATSISGSSATGKVSAQYGSGYSANITGYVGGLIGESGNDGATAISTSFGAGDVSSGLSGGNEYIGGLIGYNYSTSASAIANAYAIGSVSYTGTTTAAETAALVGYNRSGTISDSYATGYINAGDGTAGGLVAANGGTLSASYWDALTTGQSGAQLGATGATTATLQNSGTNGGLPSSWSSSIWAIVPGVSYPYLQWEFTSGTPQVVSGAAYGDRGVTPLAGATVAGLINGSSLVSAQTGGGVTSGANGYYYYLLAPNTISASGSQLLTYLTGPTPGNAFYEDATGSLASLNIFGDELLTSSASSALSTITADLATALGSNSGSEFLFSLSPGAITATPGASLEFNLTASTMNLDQTLTTSSGGAVILNDSNVVTQSAAITAPDLLLDSGGSYTLTNTGNSIGTVAGNTGALSLSDGATLTVGAVAGTTGLTTTGTVALNASAIAIVADLTGSGSGGMALTVTGAGTITNSGSMEETGTGAMTLTTANGALTNAGTIVGGASAGAITLQTTGSGAVADGAGTITQAGPGAIALQTTGTGVITADAIAYSGANPNSLTVSGTGNVTLGQAIASTGGALTTQVTSSAGAVALDSSLVTNGGDLTVTADSATQTAGTIAAGNLLLSGSGAFSLDQANQVSTLAANVGSLSFMDAQNLTLGSVQGISGITANGAITIADSGNLTIESGSRVSGASPALSATGAFINDSTDTAVVATSGRWLIYSAAPSEDRFDDLNSQNTAIWDTTFMQSPPASISASGNRYLFAYQPTLIFTSTNSSKTYGVDVTGSIASGYAVSGYQTGMTGAFLADSAASAFSGTPTVTSSGATASATVAGGPYAIDISPGSVTSSANYALSFQSPGLLTVNPATLIITASNQSKPFGTVTNLGTGAFSETGLVNGDTLSAVTLSSPGNIATATVAGSPYAISVSNAQGSGLSNYTIDYVSGLLTINPASLIITASDPDIPAVSYLQDLDPSLTLEHVGDQIDWCGLVAGGTVIISAGTLKSQVSAGKAHLQSNQQSGACEDRRHGR